MRNRNIIGGLIALALVIGTIGCSQNKANPSYKDAVSSQLKTAGFDKVNVDEDRDKGVITLKGDVQTEEDKAKAEDAAKQAAPGVVIANEIGIRPSGVEGDAKKIDSNLDSGIKDNLKASFIGNKLDKQHIDVDVTNGVVTLSGDVDTAAERARAEKVAAGIPNVSQVVNKLDVKGAKKRAALGNQ